MGAVEDLGARLVEAPRRQGAGVHGVVTEAVDDVGDHFSGVVVVTGHRQRPTVGGAGWSTVDLQVVVADVVERLDQFRSGEVLLDDLAGGASVSFELLDLSVGGGPVVHHVDDGLAREDLRLHSAVLGEGSSDHNEVGFGSLRRIDGPGSRGDDVDEHRDLISRLGGGDSDVESGQECLAGNGGADSSGPQDSDGAGGLRVNCHANSDLEPTRVTRDSLCLR